MIMSTEASHSVNSSILRIFVEFTRMISIGPTFVAASRNVAPLQLSAIMRSLRKLFWASRSIPKSEQAQQPGFFTEGPHGR